MKENAMTSPAIPSPKGEMQLENCPFCGAAGSLLPSSDHSTAWEGGCSNDDCPIGPNVWELTEAEAIAAWNRRSPSSRAEVRREALEEAAKVAEQLAGTLMHLQPTINSLVQIGSHLETCRVIATAIRSLSQGE